MPQPAAVLIFVDPQELLRHRPFFCDADLPCFLDHAQTLVDGAKVWVNPVVQVDGPPRSGRAPNSCWTAASHTS